MNFRRLVFIILLSCFSGCTKPITEFGKNYDIANVKKMKITYGTGSFSYKIRIENGHLFTRNGTKIKLSAQEKESFNDFVKCLETGYGTKFLHAAGLLKITINDSLLNRAKWRVENTENCKSPLFFAAGANVPEDGLDYSTPFWRWPLIDPEK